MRLGLAALLSSVVVMAVVRPAEACKIGGSGPYVIDEAARGTDHTPPAAIRVIEMRFRRGTAGDLAAGDCGNYSKLSLRVRTTRADPADPLGYRVNLVAGRLPDGLVLPAEPLVADTSGWLYFHWNDNAAVQGPLDFSLSVTAVDAAGNESTPSPPIVVRDRGHLWTGYYLLMAVGLVVFVVLLWRLRMRAQQQALARAAEPLPRARISR